jgi:hypothetical protein
LAKSPLRLLLFEGPSRVENVVFAVIARSWTLLVNATAEEARQRWPDMHEAWRKKHVEHTYLEPAGQLLATGAENAAQPSAGRERRSKRLGKTEVTLHLESDERRPGRTYIQIQAPGLLIATGAAPGLSEPSALPGDRVTLLDASWTHVPNFPDQEEVRESMTHGLRLRGRSGKQGDVLYVTNLPWDAALFDEVAAETGQTPRCRTCFVQEFGSSMIWRVQQLARNVGPRDVVLIGLVPGRDDRGQLQQIRSEFAERTRNVLAHPVFPLSTGPGPSRDEAVEAVGTWLPTNVLIVGGPYSEQVLLSRYLKTAFSLSNVVVGVAGAEYRLPSLAVSRQLDGARHVRAGVPRGSSYGLVVASRGTGEHLRLQGVGLSNRAETLIPKLAISAAGKDADRIVHDIEVAFSSRGMPVPAVHYVK